MQPRWGQCIIGMKERSSELQGVLFGLARFPSWSESPRNNELIVRVALNEIALPKCIGLEGEDSIALVRESSCFRRMRLKMRRRSRSRRRKKRWRKDEEILFIFYAPINVTSNSHRLTSLFSLGFTVDVTLNANQWNLYW